MWKLKGKHFSHCLAKISMNFVAGSERKLSKFPDRVGSFEEIPTVEEDYEPNKMPEVAENWLKIHGPIVKERRKTGKFVVHLFNYKDFGIVYRDGGNFPLKRSQRALTQYRNERKNLYDCTGFGAGEGEDWLKFRNWISGKTFLVRPSLQKAEEVVDEFIGIVLYSLERSKDINLLPLLYRWAYESIGIVCFNRRFHALTHLESQTEADQMVSFGAITAEIMAATMDNDLEFAENYEKLVEAQDFFYSIIQKHFLKVKKENEIKPEDYGVCQLLLQDSSCSDKNALTIIMDLFQGALQTVPLTVLMTLYNLARNIHIQELAREEVTRRLPDKHYPYYTTKGPRDYMLFIIYETLRLNPPIIGTNRVIQKDLILGGYNVPAFTKVFLHAQVAGRREENCKQPKIFNPMNTMFTHREFIFGGGRRMCPGSAFAIRQLLLIVSKLVRNFHFGYDGEELNIITKFHNRPDKPLILRLKCTEE